MQSSREQQGEIRRLLVNSAKKQRKTIERERLEISRKLENPRTFSCKDGHDKDRNGKDLTEAGEIKVGWQEYTQKTI